MNSSRFYFKIFTGLKNDNNSKTEIKLTIILIFAVKLCQLSVIRIRESAIPYQQT